VPQQQRIGIAQQFGEERPRRDVTVEDDLAPGREGQGQRDAVGGDVDGHGLAFVQPRREVGDVEAERAQRALQIALTTAVAKLDRVLPAPFAETGSYCLDRLAQPVSRLPGPDRGK
jgi:hypothetical protein